MAHRSLSYRGSGEDPEEFKYSEGLLYALCYETDVGYIPRGIKLDSGDILPKYGNSDNWNKQIQGCYWCVDNYTSWNGICCSMECLFYLHDWCIERIEHFTNKRFCRLPGCEMNSTTKDERYCNKIHKGKFDAAFAEGIDYQPLSRTDILAGPTWYSQPSQDRKARNHKSYKTNSLSKDKLTRKLSGTPASSSMDFPNELLNAMIFKTDIGPIPRQDIEELHLASPYSSSPNWLREIIGCIRCGNKSIAATGDANFCTYRCYLLFYEWCRRLVESLTGVRLCKDTGCDGLATKRFCCCSREHAKALETKYNQVKYGDFERLIVFGPCWYKKCDFPKDIAITLLAESQKQLPSDSINIPDCSSPIGARVTSRGILRAYSPEECTEQIQLTAAPYTGITKENVTIERSRSRSLPVEPGASHEKQNFIADPNLDISLKANNPSNPFTLDAIPGHYQYPFCIPQTDNIDTKFRIKSPKSPSVSSKLTCIDTQAVNRITSTQTHQPVAQPTTDTVPHNISTSHNLRLQKSQSLIEPNPQQSSNITQPDIYPFSLSTQLTDMLSQYTDVGAIPRPRAPQSPAPRAYTASPNWGATIAGCYWCELNNTSFHELTCGRRCWLLFHEWCVRKIETSCGARLCALPGCENSRASGCMCCSLEHIRDITELRECASLSIEDEVELILGPNWYSDLSPIHLSRTGAFYEFSNYFPSLLILEGSIWPTVYHYLCARKLIGTPYSNHVSRMECVKELEMWMRRRTCGKWVRADWSSVWERDTYTAVFAKFQQNSVLRGLLLRTGRRPLVCRDSSLGDMLVGLRERFKTQRFFPTGQLEASIKSVCKSINNPSIVSEALVMPSQDGVKGSLTTGRTSKSIQIPKDDHNQPFSDTGYDHYSDSDSDNNQ